MIERAKELGLWDVDVRLKSDNSIIGRIILVNSLSFVLGDFKFRIYNKDGTLSKNNKYVYCCGDNDDILTKFEPVENKSQKWLTRFQICDIVKTVRL